MESTTPPEALRVLVIGAGTLHSVLRRTCPRTLLTVDHDKRLGWMLDGPDIQEGRARCSLEIPPNTTDLYLGRD
jgi:hypothetical protein